VARSVVKVPREHHPQGKTFLVRDYTKNGQTRRLKLDGAVVELVHGHVAEHGIGGREVIFPAELVVPPPQRSKPRLTEEQVRRWVTVSRLAAGSIRTGRWVVT
jgi:hypothetical protein